MCGSRNYRNDIGKDNKQNHDLKNRTRMPHEENFSWRIDGHNDDNLTVDILHFDS